MKNNTLVLIDWVAGLVVSPLIILVKFVKMVVGSMYRPKRHGRLIIKFLGAGNYVAMVNIIDTNTTIVSAASNRSAIEQFLKPRSVIYINDSSLSVLVFTAMRAIACVLWGSFREVINLETESKFAKLLTALARSDQALGITNVHKSYLDYIVYDRYLVNPVMMGKSIAIELLTNFRLIRNEDAMAAIVQSQNDFLNAVQFHRGLKVVAFAPTGSDTDTIRRLRADLWKSVALRLISGFPDVRINVYFPTVLDPQYEEIYASLLGLQNIQFCVGTYTEYVEGIRESDLVVCIDSQTLHVANQYGVPSVCFFGPSSPYGVNHTLSTYPISLGAACSPCRHKYFCVPCNDQPVCMGFQEKDLEIFDNLKKMCP